VRKSLIVIGVTMILIGVFWPWLSRIPFGRLPGDILVERENFRLYLPLTTMLLISILVSLLLWLFRR